MDAIAGCAGEREAINLAGSDRPRGRVAPKTIGVHPTGLFKRWTASA